MKTLCAIVFLAAVSAIVWFALGPIGMYGLLLGEGLALAFRGFCSLLEKAEKNRREKDLQDLIWSAIAEERKERVEA